MRPPERSTSASSSCEGSWASGLSIFWQSFSPSGSVLCFPRYRSRLTPFHLFLLSANLFVARHGWLLGLIGPLWSISVEEQFYLVIPSVVRSFGITGLRNLALLCIATSYATLAWLAHRPATPIDRPWINSFVQFQFFAAGTLIAITQHRRHWSPSWAARISLILGGFLLIYIVDLTQHPVEQGIPASQLCAGYAGLLAGTVAIFLSFVHAPIRLPRALVYLGKISFGLYVFHTYTISFAVLGYKKLQHAGVRIVSWRAGLHFIDRITSVAAQ